MMALMNMNSLMLLACFALGSSRLPEKLPMELQQIPRSWLENQWPDIQSDARLLIEAFEIQGPLLTIFWHDYYSVWAEQYSYEKAYFAQPTEGVPGDEMLKRLKEFSRKMPINPDRMGLLAESILPPGDHTAQRRRLEELRFRRDQRTWIGENQILRRDRMKRTARRLREVRVSHLTEKGHPMPLWVYARRFQEARSRTAHDKALRATKLKSGRQMARRVPGGSAIRRISPQLEPAVTSSLDETSGPVRVVAPEEDVTRQTWRAYMQKAHNRSGSAADQNQRAEDVFAKMWRRVEIYRETHREDYAQLEKITSHRIFSERLAHLDEPVLPLFEEFKLRLSAKMSPAQ